MFSDTKGFKVFGREPALFLSSVAVLLQFLSQFLFHFTPAQQGAVNVGVSAVVGLVVTWKVARGSLVPAVLGFGQAALALLLAYGVHLDANQQSTIMAVVAMGVGWYTRTQVTAPVDETGEPVVS